MNKINKHEEEFIHIKKKSFWIFFISLCNWSIVAFFLASNINKFSYPIDGVFIQTWSDFGLFMECLWVIILGIVIQAYIIYDKED